VSVVKPFSPSCRRDGLAVSVVLLHISGVTEVTDVTTLALRWLCVSLVSAQVRGVSLVREGEIAASGYVPPGV